MEDQKAEERGVIPEHARIRHQEVVKGNAAKFKTNRPETEDAQDIWRQNRNPGLLVLFRVGSKENQIFVIFLAGALIYVT